MTPEQITQVVNFLSGLPLHGILLLIVIVLWRELKKTRADLDICLKGNYINNQRLIKAETWIENVEEMSK